MCFTLAKKWLKLKFFCLFYIYTTCAFSRLRHVYSQMLVPLHGMRRLMIYVPWRIQPLNKLFLPFVMQLLLISDFCVSFVDCCNVLMSIFVKGKGFLYLLPRVGPGADPSVQAVSPQVTISHPPGGRLPLLSVRPAVTFPAAEHHRLLAGIKLYCLVTEAHRCKQLAHCCYAALPQVEFEPTTCWSQVRRSTHCAIAPLML